MQTGFAIYEDGVENVVFTNVVMKINWKNWIHFCIAQCSFRK
jgi:thymidylate synthase ThyX